ncbi:unnamed protein product [Ciceribacter selenitireducens ATCC BAA-1503]|uniref:Uncharacterized protein n=1 Tax=Ciceribacter selenitireducens ATCC BAA-1503 TaxID=1336235 RepID=A0A376AEZ3_9HYPH|nr:unnamed protein product [Ciceribacter selenitireducens ATCC BAA-1503]
MRAASSDCALGYPPLPCRASPPQGGRSATRRPRDHGFRATAAGLAISTHEIAAGFRHRGKASQRPLRKEAPPRIDRSRRARRVRTDLPPLRGRCHDVTEGVPCADGKGDPPPQIPSNSRIMPTQKLCQTGSNHPEPPPCRTIPSLRPTDAMRDACAM